MVASGKNADFLVLDANPLDNNANTRRISRVYLRGREVDRAVLRTQLLTSRLRAWSVSGGSSDPRAPAFAAVYAGRTGLRHTLFAPQHRSKAGKF